MWVWVTIFLMWPDTRKIKAKLGARLVFGCAIHGWMRFTKYCCTTFQNAAFWWGQNCCCLRALQLLRNSKRNEEFSFDIPMKKISFFVKNSKQVHRFTKWFLRSNMYSSVQPFLATWPVTSETERQRLASLKVKVCCVPVGNRSFVAWHKRRQWQKLRILQKYGFFVGVK